VKGVYIVKNFNDIKILVVGDIMLDIYRIGEVNRISPEAPVPIVNLIKEYYTLGGCGNVARNIKELGVNVDCLSSINNDLYGKYITNRLTKLSIGNMLCYKSVKTTVKERIIAYNNNSQMIRIDHENTKPIDIINDILIDNINQYNMIVISDYAKGIVTENLINYLLSFNIPIIIDPKPNQIDIYNKVFLNNKIDNNLMITPNLKEWKEIKNEMFINKFKYILITKGQDGMELIYNKNNKLNKYLSVDSEPVSVYNVSGAGDVVLSIISICLSAGFDIKKSIYLANDCARYSVTNPNTCVIKKDIFYKFLNKYKENRKEILL
jgi:rfaE bifunctional protein kinase chain/domain